MTFICPNCNRPIDNTDINVMTDLAKCSHCQSIHKASELTATNETKRVSDQPPIGSSLQVTRQFDGTIEIFKPAKGFGASDYFIAGFMVFWLGFVAIWTSLASTAGFFALFSIPFWAVGLYMVYSLFISVYETQTLKLTRTDWTLAKDRIFTQKVKAVSTAEIQSVGTSVNSNSMKMRAKGSPPPNDPALILGSGNVFFFENANDAERDWIISFLNQQLNKK
jgi:hypothetical protein